ncbi:hypothetical protein Goklo_014399 [Gossypium klotzschianum]|uniref:CSC1/OSCA1-like N-terminal transmembrane domain-containing protein n=1 Tax=Gossypium klotzschianum TaxID=34286 RepID=A0A7J8U7P8_9ROSI|nr:hypothetical protein [Gossypium klotzschianum]
MATLSDIGVSALINILTAFAFLLAFAVLRIQPVNDRVYLPKWYINGGRSSPRSSGNFVAKFVNLNFKTYLTFLNWMPQALKMSESELINHAGLDSTAVYNAYKFAKLVRKRDRLQNWLDYNQLKFKRYSEKRPTKKTGFLGLWGKRVDSIDFYKQQIKEFDKNMALEHQKVLKGTKSILSVAFVSFKLRWGAAVCAQTQQSKNPTQWLANWAPEPRDIYWQNLAIPFLSLTIRKLIISLSVFALVFFYMILIAFVQYLANLEGLERVAPFLRPVIEL